MIIIHDKKNCCGCNACSSVCSHNAITMRPDSLGFLYPEVNPKLCTNCGLCEKMCQFSDDYERYNNYEMPKAFKFRLRNESQLKKSQSGGAFYAIASSFISEGGVVYGVAFNDTWRVVHKRVEDINSLDTLRMSKYVQSDIRGVFLQVYMDLKNGIKVLFSGTSCQIAGLKSYIPQKYHNGLFCIDIICHGVPSPQIWEDYISYLQESRRSRIVKVCFRDKRFGWHGATESFLFDNGNEEFRNTNNYLYFSGLSIRECCSNCHFTNLKRVGDITIGDHWGIHKDSPYNDEKGLSVIFVNSDKGSELFHKVCFSNFSESVNLIECLQPQLQIPTILHPDYRKFVSLFERKGFLYVAKKYGDMGWNYKRHRFVEKSKNIIKSLFRR